MDKIKTLVLGFFKKFLTETVNRFMVEASDEIYKEVDATYSLEEAAAIKVILPRLRQKVLSMIREKF